MTTDTRSLADFSQVASEGNAELILVRGETPGIVIETDPETLEHIKVEVNNGRLTLGMKSWLDYIFHAWKPVKFTVTFRELNQVTISGSCKVHADTIETQRFDFEVSGSGTMTVEKLMTEELKIHISGSGSLDLSGSAARQEIHISGSGKMEAWALESKTADARISGSGELLLKVSEALNVSISGTGEVRYLGTPKVSQSISGSGSVKQVS
jgi:hypothetical protein